MQLNTEGVGGTITYTASLLISTVSTLPEEFRMQKGYMG